MQKSIQHHTNPMKHKRPFIKKCTINNSSFISKPNLSITKASHRFSLDKTFINTDRRQQQYLRTARDQQREFTYPEMFQEAQHPFTERASLKPLRNHSNKQSARRNSLQKLNHKQKLQQILQSIDLNTTIIHELFQQDQEISLIKQQINKTYELIDNVHHSLQKEVHQSKQLRKSTKKPYNLQTRIKDMAKSQLCNKIHQLRKKRLSFVQKENRQYTKLETYQDQINRTFT